MSAQRVVLAVAVVPLAVEKTLSVVTITTAPRIPLLRTASIKFIEPVTLVAKVSLGAA